MVVACGLLNERKTALGDQYPTNTGIRDVLLAKDALAERRNVDGPRRKRRGGLSEGIDSCAHYNPIEV